MSPTFKTFLRKAWGEPESSRVTAVRFIRANVTGLLVGFVLFAATGDQRFAHAMIFASVLMTQVALLVLFRSE